MSIWRGKIVSIAVFFIFLIGAVGAQSHNSVPIDETDLYRLLEMAEISGRIDPLPSARPLPLSVVKKALRQLQNSQYQLSVRQKNILNDYIKRFVVDENEFFLRDAEIRHQHDIFPLSWRFYAETDSSIDVADISQSGTHNIFGGILAGDLGKSFSYKFEINAQLNKVNIDDNAPYPYAWAPYTYTKRWDGGARYLKSPSPQILMPRGWALGWALYPEMAFSLWENQVNFRFGRVRRDWGFGEGNLFLDKQARPFMGVEGSISPLKWLTFNFVIGGLEYSPTFRNSPFQTGAYPANGNNDSIGIKEVARVQQNMISLFQLEVRPTKWLYIAFYDAAIYLKRFELGYMFPFMPSLLFQNNTGDYDNLLFGGTLALIWPNLLRAYGTILLDEWNPKMDLNALRNQIAFQAGIKLVPPIGVWSLATFQYTKIEPFTYSHYATSGSPWFYSNPENPTLEMETGYQNNGENLGSYLEPNSDEFLLSFHTQPGLGWSAGGSYRLIRHGGEGVNGSSYDTWGYFKDGGADGDPKGAYYEEGSKNFLKDGTYEWFHIFSLGASFDMRNLFAPIRISLQYNLVYKYDSDYTSKNNFTAVSGSETFRHLFGINVKVWSK